MHGRVKVRSSEEEKLRKEKERQAKLKLFRNVMTKIQSKRNNNEFDKELLELTGQLLAANPDIYTLWNIRREVIEISRKEILEPEELIKLHDSELCLTECCLKVNPKSYCAWHQREWILTTRQDPNWKNELDLCNLYLKYDERNFHVWDYRRFIISQHDIKLDEEFKYTTEKIHENFSNYSAWHYRSKMLVELYPDKEGGRPIADVQHKNELELVQNAAFTDPDDTSAWFYQRWLLSAVKKIKEIVVCTVKSNIVTVAFNTSVNRAQLSNNTKVYFNDETVSGTWSPISGEYDSVWIFCFEEKLNDDMKVKVEYTTEDRVQVLECALRRSGQGDSGPEFTALGYFNFRNKYSEPVIDELKKQLDSCYQLLKLEPNSKWTLLTTTILMHCCNPDENLSLCLTNLEKLKEIDHLRSGYYADLSSKWIIENYLETQKDKIGEALLPLSSLYTKTITSLYHMNYLSACMSVDLSGQKLTSRSLPALSALYHCEVLSLKDNAIETLKTMPYLPHLRSLLLEGNSIKKDEIETYKCKYPNICVQ